MEKKQTIRPEDERRITEQRSHEPLKLPRVTYLRVGALLSTLVASGGSTNWR